MPDAGAGRPWRARLAARAAALRGDALALWYALRHPGTPLAARLAMWAIVAYALSPIDLVPDFIPVLGYLDELILLPLAIALVRRLVPPAVMAECRARAEAHLAAREGRPRSLAGAVLIVVLWIAAAALLWLAVAAN